MKQQRTKSSSVCCMLPSDKVNENVAAKKVYGLQTHSHTSCLRYKIGVTHSHTPDDLMVVQTILVMVEVLSHMSSHDMLRVIGDGL